jgi:hypothetical protein
VRLLVTALAIVTLAVTGCSNDTVLKESPEQIRQEQVTADAHNESTTTVTTPEAPPTTDPAADPAFD